MDDNSLADKYSHLDYEKSIKRQRLIYKPEGSLIFEIIPYYIFLIVFVGLGFAILFQQITDPHRNPVTIGVILFALTLLISNAVLKNHLVKFEGKIAGIDRNDIFEMMDKFFSSYDFVVNDERIMRSFKPEGSPIWGRIITILFDGNTMYLNIITLGRSNSPTWIHAPLNYIKAKRIARYYRLHYT